MSALSRLKEQKQKAKTQTKPKKETKSMAEPQEEEVLELSIEDIEKMKAKDLDELHSDLPEQIEGWADLKGVKEKRAAVISALTGEDDIDADLDGNVVELEEKKVEAPKKESTQKAKKATTQKAKTAKTVTKTESTNSDLEEEIHQIENLSEEESNKRVIDLSEDIEFNYFKLGGVLAHIKDRQLFDKDVHSTFRDKVEDDFGMKYRKADYLINIFLNIVNSGVPFTKVQQIGWTKLKEIAHLLTEDNVDDWVEKAQSMNVSTLKAEVKNLASGDQSDSTSSKTVTSEIKSMSFKFHEDQRETVETALAKAQEATGSDNKSVNMEAICLDYNSGGATKVQVKEPTVTQFFEQQLNKAEDETEALENILYSDAFEKVFGLTFDSLVEQQIEDE